SRCISSLPLVVASTGARSISTAFFCRISGIPPNHATAREKQTELSTQLATVQSQRAKLAKTGAEHEGVIRDATALLPPCGEAYRRGDDTLRRDYNQAWFEKILVDSDQGQPKVTGVTRTELFRGVQGGGGAGRGGGRRGSGGTGAEAGTSIRRPPDGAG